jgi:hypothetical protein
MTRRTCGAAVLVAVLQFGAPASSFAQEEEIDATPAEAPPAGEAPEAAPARPETIKAIVRGLYVGASVGGGYMVLNDDVEPTTAYPQASGSEGLGGGSTIRVAIGYDLTDVIALQALGGVILASGSRDDLVRDLSILLGGAGVRLSFDIRHRLNMVASVGVGYASADNAVEEPETGVAAFGGFGIEYYVHVRHFSVGVDLSVFAPISPMRVFVAVTPQIKYTF